MIGPVCVASLHHLRIYSPIWGRRGGIFLFVCFTGGTIYYRKWCEKIVFREVIWSQTADWSLHRETKPTNKQWNLVGFCSIEPFRVVFSVFFLIVKLIIQVMAIQTHKHLCQDPPFHFILFIYLHGKHALQFYLHYKQSFKNFSILWTIHIFTYCWETPPA